MGNCHPEKTIFDRVEAKVDIGFLGVTFPMLPSSEVNILI